MHQKSLDSNSGQQVSEVLDDSKLVKLIEDKSTQCSSISKDIKSNSDDMVSIQKSFRIGLIDILKKEGNDHFKLARYSNAIELYSKAFDVFDLVEESEVIGERMPAILCTNMGICLFKLHRYEES